MNAFYNAGENKIRPGVYQRHSNTGFTAPVSGPDGICAIPIKGSWGPLGEVVRHNSKSELSKTYGAGTYGDGYTVQAAEAMFDGGASTVYTYRLGTGGKSATKELTEGLTITAKYPGDMAISIAVKEKLGDATKKMISVYAGTALVETFEFDADGKAEGANLIKAIATSNYITASGSATTVAVLAEASGKLEGGSNPTVTNEDYSKAFNAFEPYYYNTIALDKDDDENMTLSMLLQSYLDGAYKLGKLGIAVVGEKTTVDFETRCSHAAAFNDAKCVYLGGGYKAGAENKDGVLAICYTAGAIAATPSNQGITHSVINGATDLCESLTFSQYEDAIRVGMVLLSSSPDGSIWYDTGITTLTKPEEATQDEGWKKIRRVKARFEAIYRLDCVLSPKVGKVSADSDGIADIIQAAQRELDAMVSEGKFLPGATFVEDPENPYNGDSAWFIIQADDLDSLEKIYMHYQFRYSQNV